MKDKESKAERKAKGAQKWNAEASELNQAMQARMEDSPIWKDENLSDQAKKGESSPSPGRGRRIKRIRLMPGLYYCELHAASQVKLQEPNYRWKFNKARQGWLMRNVWNDTEVGAPFL